jgi:hypothetical protein
MEMVWEMRSRARFALAVVIACLAGCALAGTALAWGSGGDETVASDLANPRGIATAPGKRLLVVESATGVIDEVRHGEKRVFATVPGAVDVATNKHGTYVVVGGPPPDAPPPPAGTVTSSALVRIGDDGKSVIVADIGAYQVAHPDPDDLDMPANPAESNPNGLALLSHGRVLVADAAANDLLLVDKDGQITTVAHFKPESVAWNLPFPPPPGGSPVLAEAVPTAVAVGPDGAYYVSELTGFPFTKGAARIWRIEPGSVDAVCDPLHLDPSSGCTSVATGFSSVIDLTFGHDCTMYVLEIARDGLAGALVFDPPTEFPPTGALWAVNKDGVKTSIADSLVAPGGVAVDKHGGIFVTTLTFGPPGGTVIRLGGRGHDDDANEQADTDDQADDNQQADDEQVDTSQQQTAAQAQVSVQQTVETNSQAVTSEQADNKQQVSDQQQVNKEQPAETNQRADKKEQHGDCGKKATGADEHSSSKENVHSNKQGDSAKGSDEHREST